MKPGEDCKRWFYKDERYNKIVRKKRLIEYQIMMFKRELLHEEQMMKELTANEPRRKELYGARYDTLEDLQNDYLTGALRGKAYRHERYMLWLVYSDRGHLDRIDWLKEMIAECEERLGVVNVVMEKYNINEEKRERDRRNAKIRMRRYNARKRGEDETKYGLPQKVGRKPKKKK